MAKSDPTILKRLQQELARVSAQEARVSLDREFEPESGPLAKLQLEDAYWHLLPAELLKLLESLPDGAGSEAVKQTIEQNATTVWHGPAPEGSRDTSF